MFLSELLILLHPSFRFMYCYKPVTVKVSWTSMWFFNWISEEMLCQLHKCFRFWFFFFFGWIYCRISLPRSRPEMRYWKLRIWSFQHATYTATWHACEFFPQESFLLLFDCSRQKRKLMRFLSRAATGQCFRILRTASWKWNRKAILQFLYYCSVKNLSPDVICRLVVWSNHHSHRHPRWMYITKKSLGTMCKL